MRIAERERRIHIGIFGRRNTGKTSLLNALARQTWANVLEVKGRSDEVTEKVMDFFPLGPTLFFDTPGMDETGTTVSVRAKSIQQTMNRIDMAAIVTEPGCWGKNEESLAGEILSRNIPFIVVVNKSDKAMSCKKLANLPKAYHNISVPVSALTRGGLNRLRRTMLSIAPPECLQKTSLLSGLVGPDETAVFVMSTAGKAAISGRHDLFRSRALQAFLDNEAPCLVVNVSELPATLSMMKREPGLVVTDAQIFLKVAADIPSGIPLTCISVLFARYGGDLITEVEGMMSLGRLNPGDRVLISESCMHHPACDNIGRDKIPGLLNQYVGGELEFVYCFGRNFPKDLDRYNVVIHCPACSLNRREMLEKIMYCADNGVSITNSELAMAFCIGIFERALEPFPFALEVCRMAQRRAEAL